MAKKKSVSRFEARLLRPAQPRNASWAFVVLPEEASAQFPRRGRTTAEGTINGQPLHATLEPDGRLSHWFKVDAALCKAAGATAGDLVVVEIAPVAREPEPKLPPDLRQALEGRPRRWRPGRAPPPWRAWTGSTG